MSLDAVLGTLLDGRKVTAQMIVDFCEGRDLDEVLGTDPEGRTWTVGEALAGAQRVAALPHVVPMEDRLPDGEWAEAVYMRGEAPYGRCPYCQCALGVAGCLNLCTLPAAMADKFHAGLREAVSRLRAKEHVMEQLMACTCPPPRLNGYEFQRRFHEGRCPAS